MSTDRRSVARRLAASAAAAVLLAGVVAGTAPATPAEARPPLSIPICETMLPERSFMVIPGLNAVRPYTPRFGTVLYGATSPTLQSIIRSNPHRTCSWSAGLLDKSFTISEVDVDAKDISRIRAWYAAAGLSPSFYGGDAEFYVVSTTGAKGWTQVHILEPDGAWITVTDRYFSAAGAISQDAIARLVEINYWLEP